MSNHDIEEEKKNLKLPEQRENKPIQNCSRHATVDALVSGSLSSAFTTVIYQPLELVKTRIQLSKEERGSLNTSNKIIGRTYRSFYSLSREHNVLYLWRGTGASLIRSIPGVGLYYASLNILQNKFSEQIDKPDGAAQAFCFGITARSTVSFLLLPITVIKVRYESGQYNYSSLHKAIGNAYLRDGWVGVTPTILRDSIFSGVYYMFYTKLKSHYAKENSSNPSSINFVLGLVSGLLASFITNPLDVIKTKIQVKPEHSGSITSLALKLTREHRGYLRFFDGLLPRSMRRALIAATTWSFYEFFITSLQTR